MAVQVAKIHRLRTEHPLQAHPPPQLLITTVARSRRLRHTTMELPEHPPTIARQEVLRALPIPRPRHNNRRPTTRITISGAMGRVEPPEAEATTTANGVGTATTTRVEGNQLQPAHLRTSKSYLAPPSRFVLPCCSVKL